MKIEAGKEYRTRGGKKAIVYAVNRGGSFPVHGAIKHEDMWTVESWTCDGTSIVYDIYAADLVSEWIEKPIFDHWDKLPEWIDEYMAMDSNGNWYAYFKKPFSITIGWASEAKCIVIPVNYRPNFEGSWEDSLIKNPKYN